MMIFIAGWCGEAECRSFIEACDASIEDAPSKQYFFEKATEVQVDTCGFTLLAAEWLVWLLNFQEEFGRVWNIDADPHTYHLAHFTCGTTINHLWDPNQSPR